MDEKNNQSCNIENMKDISDIVSAFLDGGDPLGSYSGHREDGDVPEQDADDL